jgi:hypothetical protein
MSKDTFLSTELPERASAFTFFGCIFGRMKHLLFLFFLVSTNNLCAQTDPDTTGKISGIAEVIFFPGKSFQSFGLQIEAPVSKRMYVNYHFGMGTTSEGGLYVHAPLGAAGGCALFVDALEGEKGLGWVGVLLCLVPEGITYRIPVGRKLEFLPYFNPLQCDYRIRESTYGEEFNLSGDAGLRVAVKFPMKFFFQAHCGSKLLYNNGEWGAEGGISLGKFF